MIKDILKTALSVGGNMLFPGAGTLATSLVDAAVPSDQTTTAQSVASAGATATKATDPSPTAQTQQGTDWGKIGGAAFGVAGGIAGSLLNKPSVDPMKQQLELAYKNKIQSTNQNKKNQIMQSLGGMNANV